MYLIRLLIPKNFLFYLLFLAIALIYIIAALWGYYHLQEIEHFFNGVPLPFLDLHQSGNVLDWFYSILWIHIAILSIIILSSTIEHRESFIQILFWINVPLIALILSADTICSFSSFILHLIELEQRNSATKIASLIILRFVFFFFVLLEFWLLFQYIRTRNNSRLLLTLSAMICFLTLFLVFLFGSAVPREEIIRRNHEPILQKILMDDNQSPEEKEKISPKSKMDKTDKKRSSDKDRPFPDSQEDDPLKNEEDPEDENIFRNASEEHKNEFSELVEDPIVGSEKEKKNEKDPDHREYKWEDVFGWEKSFEDYWKLEGKLEEYLGMSGSIESHLWGNKTPDISRIRESIHYGGTGFFLLILSLTIQLIVRAGRVATEKKILRHFGEIAAVCEFSQKS